MPSENITNLKCFKCPLAFRFYFSTCDHCSIYALPAWSAACCFLTVSSCLSSLPLPLTSTFYFILPSLHLCFPHSLLFAADCSILWNLSFIIICLFICLHSPLCFTSSHSLSIPISVSKYLTFLLSLFLIANLLFIFPNYSGKTSIYLSFPINVSIYLNSPLIHFLSPTLVLQDIRGGNRLLQPLLSNDLSGGAILSQEIGGLPLHHPHRR